ncbi:GAP family protein [Actinomadura sp. ATCC 31491]|uniref:GAP family protein n=1 Tax=Actinomadura luzonensis TaxID=2805427 RepID=A0ABT0FXE2_9ACTN|nr:GAP family protein [Actinomadura luzonensis]MCK2216997.1 GAP family protein [Actinomadura luzonensis]
MDQPASAATPRTVTPASPSRRITRTAAAPLGVYLATVAAAYFALGVLLMLGLNAVVPLVDGTAWAWGQGVLGAALVVGSFFIPGGGSGRAVPRERSLTARSMLLLGLGTWLFEFATAVPYFGAVGVMTAAGLSPAQWLPLLAAYVTVMVLPGILLPAAWTLLGDRLRDRFGRWHDRLSAGSRTTLSWIVGIAGVVLLLDALPDQITVTAAAPLLALALPGASPRRRARRCLP